MSVAAQVRSTFQRLAPGGLLASADLHRLSQDKLQVDKAVSRLYQKEGLYKIRNGLYFKPVGSRYFGDLPPKAGVIIKGLARQYNARIVPSGSLAAYELGFVGTPPEQRLYDTNKRIGTITLENDILHFRSVVGKKLNVGSLELITVLNALEFFFKTYPHLGYSQQQFIKRQLDKFSSVQIKQGLAARPQWLRDRIESIIQTTTSAPYITGISALNIPYKGRVGDWHQAGMLESNKFQIAGDNYYSAPGLNTNELFDCAEFLSKHEVVLETTLCARSERAIKDLLYTNIIVKNRYPSFFKKDQYLLPVSDQTLRACVDELRPLVANAEQLKYFDKWLADNDVH